MAHAVIAEIRAAIIDEVPSDGSAIGNLRLRERISEQLAATVDEQAYIAALDELIAAGTLAKGQGRGGSVRRILDDAPAPALALQTQEVPAEAKLPKPKQASLSMATRKPGVPTKTARKPDDGARVIAYRHDQKRINNPDVGVVTPETDPEQPKTTWAYDPHIDPALQFDSGRAEIENLIDDAIASGDDAAMRTALETLKRMASPYLNWAGKAERSSFEIDTVSLHVHERIDPATILAAVRQRMKQSKSDSASQSDFFRAWFEEPLPYREAIEFYKHDRGWSNRLIAGDSLLVMNSLLQKESMAGQVQMIYIDPPYGIKYGSNFQPFVNKRDVKDRSDADLTQEPEMIKAFRDTWELGIHSYLTYLRDRLLLAKELLHESGSVFVQISDQNLHLVRNLLDDIFGGENFSALIAYSTTGGFASATLSRTGDYVLWYAKNLGSVKFRRQYLNKTLDDAIHEDYDQIELQIGQRRALTREEKSQPSVLVDRGKVFTDDNPTSQGEGAATLEFEYVGLKFHPGQGNHWKAPVPHGMRRLARTRRFYVTPKSKVRYVRYFEDFSFRTVTNAWFDIAGAVQDRSDPKVYVVQTSNKIIERCLLMTTDPGDLVLDPTCGSGTTAFVAEKWGRRWITCDTSRVATTLAKQRLMTASYDYYELKYPHEGLRGGFIYKTVPHVTLKSIANNPEIDEIYERLHPAVEQTLAQLNAALKTYGAPFKVSEGGRKGTKIDFGKKDALQEWEVPFEYPTDWKAGARAAFDAFHAARQTMQRRMDDSIAAHADQETLYDQPAVSKDKLRITGPFTVEAVPFPTVLALDESSQSAQSGDSVADASIARSGESARQHRWRDELLKTGIRGKNGQMLKFAELEILPDTRYLHCSGHLNESLSDKSAGDAVSGNRGGERVVVSFGPEYAALEQRQVELAMREAGELFPRPKMIVFCAFTFDPEAAKDIDATRGIVALKAQMNTDLLTDDLKKNRSSNQSFWLMGQPDVDVRQRKDGQYEVEVNGFDYFDTSSGELKSGGKNKIAVWSLDTDYDERSLFPRQVFFPMAGAKDGWNKLKRNIRAELDESLLDKLHGTVSLPFEAGPNRRVAVKIVDDRGIESLKVIALD